MDLEEADMELFAQGPSNADKTVIFSPYESHPLKTKRRRTLPSSIKSKNAVSEYYMQFYRERKLLSAASLNDVERVNELLENNWDPNGADELGRTPLHLAASRGYHNIVHSLIANGANANAEDKLGNTPLHLAVYTGSVETVANLLRGGGENKRTAKLPYTPLDLVKSKYSIMKNQTASLQLQKLEICKIYSLLREATLKSRYSELLAITADKPVDHLLKDLENLDLEEHCNAD